MLTEVPAAGGTVYDAFIVELLRNAGAEVIVTYNVDEFRRIAANLRVMDPTAL